MRRLVFVALGAFFLAAALLPTQQKFVVQAVSDGERLAMYSKPAVVRIVDGAAGQFYFQPPRENGQTYNVSSIGLGSGFFISSDGYVATNAHVVSSTKDGEQKMKQALFMQLVVQVARAYGKDPRSLTEANINFIDQNSRLTNFQHFHHVIIPDGSSFPFEIKEYGAPTGESNDQGKDVAIVKIEVKNAPVLKIADSDKVQLQDHVTVIGYPGAADTFNSGLLNSKSTFEATINDGKISARKQATSGAPILQTSAPATHGNSGGPVLNDQQEVIGLLTFRGDTVNGQEVSGFSFVVPSNTLKEYVKSAGTTPSVFGPTDTSYREGLEYYWDNSYSSAIPKFEEVKRLFPQHSEVDRLIQSSQQAKAEGKEKSSFSIWIIVIVLVVLFVIALIVIIGIIIALMARKKGKNKKGPSAGPSGAHDKPAPSPSYSPAPPSSPSPSYTPAPPSPPPPPMPIPQVNPADQGMTVDLSRTIAISPDLDTAPINYGSLRFVSGPLSGQEFEIKADGEYVGRDSTASQICLADPRISKRHLWIGVKEGRVVVVDQNSRNGTFVNDPKSPRVTETTLSPGDTVILGESDVARFEYKN